MLEGGKIFNRYIVGTANPMVVKYYIPVIIYVRKTVFMVKPYINFITLPARNLLGFTSKSELFLKMLRGHIDFKR